jgi:nucleoid-associated protein YgaU
MGIRDKDTEAGSTSTPDITGHTYVVRVGDTLTTIAQKMLGDSGASRDIFNANRDQLSDPNALRPGQVLKIPTLARR